MTSITQYCHWVESPIGGIARRLVRHLVEDVGQVVDGVDDLPDVGLLDLLDAGVEREDLVIDDGGDTDAVDVVGRVERMALDVVGRGREVEAEAFEQHDRDVDARATGDDDAVAETVEVGPVEGREVELWLAIRRHTRAGARPGLRRHAEVDVGRGEVALELFPPPEPDEVVAVVPEEPEVGSVVELLRLVRAVAAEAQAVVEIVVDVRTGQVDDPPFGLVAGCDREVARVCW